MESYKTVLCESSAEYTEKRSRFIALLGHCETEEQASEFVNAQKSKYHDARHNCYAYIVEKGAVKRFSDDGEPHGTAGKPMLDILNGLGLTDVCVVVTRYFGGVLLGTGGLVRAYSAAAKAAAESAEHVTMRPCTAFSCSCSYSESSVLSDLILRNGGTITKTEYFENVEYEFYFPEEKKEDFKVVLRETFSARLTADERETALLPLSVS